MFRIQATADRMSGKYDDCNKRSSGWRPLALTISIWYFSSDARFLSASAAWHWTLGDDESMRFTSDWMSLVSFWASFFRLLASTAMLLSAVVQ